MKKFLIALLLLTAACHKKDVSLDPDLDIATWPYCQYVLAQERVPDGGIRRFFNAKTPNRSTWSTTCLALAVSFLLFYSQPGF